MDFASLTDREEVRRQLAETALGIRLHSASNAAFADVQRFAAFDLIRAETQPPSQVDDRVAQGSEVDR
jgi:hypothetical protein